MYLLILINEIILVIIYNKSFWHVPGWRLEATGGVSDFYVSVKLFLLISRD